MDRQCLQALGHAESLCRDLGHHCKPVEIRYDSRAYGQAFTLILSAKVAASVDYYEQKCGSKATADQFEPAVWHCVELGRRASAAALNRATAHLHLVACLIMAQTAGVDVVMSPTLARPPILLGELVPSGNDIGAFLAKVFEFAPFTSPFNATGQPAISLPLSRAVTGLLIGIQFAAPYGREDLLLRLAADLESAARWLRLAPRPLGA